MAVAVANIDSDNRQPQRVGQYEVKLCTITFDASYPTGGLALTPAQCGLSKIIMAYVHPALGYVPTYVRSTGKIIVRGGAASSGTALQEVANATDLSAVAFHAQVWGY